MSSINKESKIAIIGAGPSGLGAAEALFEQGYKNTTVFEKTEGVGGMCRSAKYKPKDESLPEITYDLGSIQPAASQRLFKIIK